MLYLKLFIEFFKTGLFAIGGGLATLPFLYEMQEKTGWFTVADLTHLIAVSESTPGPMGVNMATYTGFVTGGIPGSIIAVLGLVTPSVIIIMIVCRILDRFRNNRYVEWAMYGLKAASCALILSAGLSVAQTALLNEYTSFSLSMFNWPAIIFAAVLYVVIKVTDRHPVVYIIASAAAGVILIPLLNLG